LKIIFFFLLYYVLLSGVLLGTDYIKARIVGMENGPEIQINNGGTWKSDMKLQFPSDGRIYVSCSDGSTAFIDVNGTWAWFIKKSSYPEIYGAEKKIDPPVSLNYEKFKNDKNTYYDKPTQYGCEVLQLKQNSDGSCYVVVNTTREIKGSYEKTGVIKVDNFGDKNTELPKAGEKCLVNSIFKGWINYTMNCGTIRFVPLFVLDPLYLCFIFVNPNDFVIR